LGADVNGCVIENKRRNKGQFIADFKQAIAPDHTEFGVLIWHKREPACVIEITTCNSDPGYPVQTYGSANTICVDEHTGTSPFPINTTLTFTPVKNSVVGDYEVAANSAICEGGPVQHGQISGTTTLAALVVQLNFVLEVAGTWTVLNATQIQLTGPCASFSCLSSLALGQSRLVALSGFSNLLLTKVFMADDYYGGDPGESSDDPPESPDDKKDMEGETALLPKSFFVGQDLKPGDEFYVEVVREHEGEVEVKYGKGPEKGEKSGMDESMGALDGMASDKDMGGY
jgi:hypothetical protein